MGLLISSQKLCCFTGGIVNVNGRRLKISPLGEGGFSVIYLGEDLETGQVCVLKRMTCVDSETVKEAVREAELYQLFNHPNIIKCIDSSVTICPSNPEAKDVYMLLPFYRRGTLQALIDENNERGIKFLETEMLEISLGIAQGLLAMHNFAPEGSSEVCPLAHRDVKPANILLGSDNTPILMDFGSVANAIVKIENRAQALALQELAAERCTMPYRAPELFDVKSQTVVDEKVDVWSLGCVIYCMTYGTSPFETAMNEQGGSIALAVMNGVVSFPKEDNYSKRLRELITWMLQVDPEKRPKMEQVVARISDLLSPAS